MLYNRENIFNKKKIEAQNVKALKEAEIFLKIKNKKIPTQNTSN